MVETHSADVASCVVLPFAAGGEGRNRAKLSNAQVRMLRYEVLSELRELRNIWVRGHSAAQADPTSGEFADAVLLNAFGFCTHSYSGDVFEDAS